MYTPLEQYGGDSGHTDTRSDIYSFGATLYHILTNQQPMDARERFLHPESMVLPRQINSGISMRTERAILWAMGLHPNERPQTIEEFRQALLGDYIPSTRTQHTQPLVKVQDYFKTKPEKYMMLAVAVMLGISLIVTLVN